MLRDLAAGRYVLQARASGHGEASISGVRVVVGAEDRASAPSGSGRGGIVRGTVVDADGQGIPGATVSRSGTSSTCSSDDFVDQTGSTGAFEIRGVPAGRLSVGASTRRMPRQSPSVAEVEPGEGDRGAPRIVLLEGGRVEGRAVHRDGRPFASGRVRAAGPRAGAEGILDDAVHRSGPDGSFVIDHVTAGRTRSSSWPPRHHGALTGVASREVVLREGETATVDFSLRDVVVAGTRDPRRPARSRRSRQRAEPGGRSSTVSYGGPRDRALSWLPPVHPSSRRRRGGRRATSSLVFTPGRARVGLDSVAGNQSYPGREVDVPDVDRFELDLEIADDGGLRDGRGQGQRRPGPGRERRGSRTARARRNRGRTGASRSPSSRGSTSLEAQARTAARPTSSR